MRNHVRILFHKLWVYLPFGCFVAAVLCLCFVFGVAVGKWQVFPYGFLDKGLDSLRDVIKPKRLHFLRSARYEAEGVVLCERGQVSPGMTLLTGHWKNGDDYHLGIRLISLDGRILHEWRTNPRDIWEKDPHHDYAAGKYNDKASTIIHGALLLPNGDVVFNLEKYTLVKMNLNSEVVWKLPYRTHHSIMEDSEKNYWVCGAKFHDKNTKYVGLKPPLIEDMIVKVSPEGVVEREISLLEVIYKSGYDGLLRFRSEDILHLNDVEVLTKDKADAFKGTFQAGDILVSLCHINTIFVIDGKSELIKWCLTEPFIHQHDPDFTEDGYITVFDNHCDWLGHQYASQEQGSRIVRIEPSTKSVTTLYGWDKNQYLYTIHGGKVQHLPNGNMLITESDPGRVLEINTDGEIVWDWIVERWDEDSVPEIMQGTRYGVEYADFVSGLRKEEK